MTIAAVIAATLLELDAIKLIHTVRLATGSVALTALPITLDKVIFDFVRLLDLQ